jgi:signal transduction histidine kinase
VASQNEELRATMEELKDKRLQLHHAEKMASLGVMTAGLTHEINNPVNFINASVQGLSLLMERVIEIIREYEQINETNFNQVTQRIQLIKNEGQVEDINEEITLLINNIQKGIRRTANLIKSLRTFSRMDMDELAKSNINENIELTLTILSSQINKAIKIKKQYADLPEVYCYPGSLNQVFMNVISNAAQSISGKGVITITTSLQDNDILVTVKDTGAGIPESIQNRVFEPFFTSKEPGKGTGLGLSISYSIMEMHKGTITFTSTEKEGTEFQIRFPSGLKPIQQTGI